MSKKKQKNEVSSADSLDAAKEITPTQPTPTPLIDEAPVKATIDEIEMPAIEETIQEIETPQPPVIDEAAKQDDKAPETVEIELRKEIADTFKARPHIKAAYVSGDQWFFDKTIAKQVFKTFDVIENPFHQE